jgi:hypothetical protein
MAATETLAACIRYLPNPAPVVWLEFGALEQEVLEQVAAPVPGASSLSDFLFAVALGLSQSVQKFSGWLPMLAFHLHFTNQESDGIDEAFKCWKACLIGLCSNKFAYLKRFPAGYNESGGMTDIVLAAVRTVSSKRAAMLPADRNFGSLPDQPEIGHLTMHNIPSQTFGTELPARCNREFIL